MITSLKDCVNRAVRADSPKEYRARFTIRVENSLWKVHAVSIANRDILAFCDKGCATFLVDSYSDRYMCELFDWEKGE